MKRIAFKMYLKEGMKEEYRRRHEEIWPEVAALLRGAGISDYSIFLDEKSQTLFAVQTIEGPEGSQRLGTEPVIRRWWDYMADMMMVNPDNSPVSEELEELFFLK